MGETEKSWIIEKGYRRSESEAITGLSCMDFGALFGAFGTLFGALFFGGALVLASLYWGQEWLDFDYREKALGVPCTATRSSAAAAAAASWKDKSE